MSDHRRQVFRDLYVCSQRYLPSIKRHAGNRKGYELLETSLTDQRDFVKEHFALPCRGYSIKDVAPVFGFNWQAEDAGGMNCEAWFLEWLETRNRALYERIVQYNRDDVLAMEIIHNALKDFCSTNGKKR